MVAAAGGRWRKEDHEKEAMEKLLQKALRGYDRQWVRKNEGGER